MRRKVRRAGAALGSGWRWGGNGRRRGDWVQGYDLFPRQQDQCRGTQATGRSLVEASLEEFFLCRYEKMKAEALATEDTDPYPPPSDEVKFVAASNRWWKQWFVDETPTVDLLRDYKGMISFHLGEIDSQTPGARQIAFANARVSTHKSKLALVLHPGRGHAFRTGEPLYGPMDEQAEEQLAQDITLMLQRE